MTDIGAHQFGTALPTVGNRYNPGAVPSWANISAGVASQISLSASIRDAALAGGAGSYSDSISTVDGRDDDLTVPWCGGAIVTISGEEHLIVLGGGHTDGAWNGHVGVNLSDESPGFAVTFPASDVGDLAAGG